MTIAQASLRRGVFACLLLSAPAAAQAPGSSEVPSLMVSLKSPDAAVRASAARILGELGSGARAALQDLIGVLKDGEREVRQNAATAIGQIGPPAPDAVGPLAALLKDKDWQVRRAAAVSLGRLHDKQAEEPLKAARKDKNKSVSDAANRALSELKKAKKK